MVEQSFSRTRGLRRTSTAEELTEELQALILAGELRPGGRLVEAQLAARFEVSRNTLREALQELSRRGLVHHRPHRGGIVAQPTAEDVREIFNVRRAIEPSALGAIRPQDLAALSATATALEESAAVEDWPRVAELDIRFHSQIVGAIGSHRLHAFFLSLLQTLRLAFITLDRDRAGSGDVPEHRTLVNALLARREEHARTILLAHLQAAEAAVLDAVGGDET